MGSIFNWGLFYSQTWRSFFDSETHLKKKKTCVSEFAGGGLNLIVVIIVIIVINLQ